MEGGRVVREDGGVDNLIVWLGVMRGGKKASKKASKKARESSDDNIS